jgi:hypothetical protein
MKMIPNRLYMDSEDYKERREERETIRVSSRDR